MADTGYPLKDALTNLQTLLDSKKADWSISEVHAYPAYERGVGVNSLCLEILSDTRIVATQFGAPHEFDYEISIRITYIGPKIRSESQYHNSLDMITNLWIYLLQNPNPGNFGTLKAVEDMTIGDMELVEGAKVAQASIDVTLHVTKTITES